MKILTNARHWKQDAYGLVEIKYSPEKDMLRARLQMITKWQSHASALANMPTSGSDFIIVPTNANCSTPEQIIDAAVEIWKAARQNRQNALK